MPEIPSHPALMFLIQIIAICFNLLAIAFLVSTFFTNGWYLRKRRKQQERENEARRLSMLNQAKQEKKARGFMTQAIKQQANNRKLLILPKNCSIQQVPPKPKFPEPCEPESKGGE